MADATASLATSDPRYRAGRTLCAHETKDSVRPLWRGAHYIGCMGSAHWSTTQLEPGELRVDAKVVAAHGAIVSIVSFDRTSLHSIRTPLGFTSLLVHGGTAGALFLAGREITPYRCARIASSTEFELIAHGGTTMMMVSLWNTPHGNESTRLHESIRSVCTPIDLIDVGAEGFSLQEQVLTALLCARSPAGRMAADLVWQYALLLSQRPLDLGCNREKTGDLHLARARRRTAVELARQYVRDHMSERIQLADLCACTHVQARSLEYGFQEVARLSPMRYVRMLRLGEIRRQLIECRPPLRSISELALDAGFTHLSQFAADYKRVFGETPSATRRRVLAGLILQGRRARDTATRNRTGPNFHRATVAVRP